MTGLSIALANLKPGTGKTTSAVWLAHVFAQAGNRVLLVDADPSGSALEWSDLAAMDPRLSAPEAAFPFRVVALPSRELHRRVPEIAQADDVVIIDTPQLEDHIGIARSALRYADEILVPCAPSPIEINRTTPVRDEIAEIGGDPRPARPLGRTAEPVHRAGALHRRRPRGARAPRLRRAGHGGAAARGLRPELRPADQADRLRRLAQCGPGPHRPVRSPMLGPVMTSQREQRKAQMAAAAARRAEPDARPAGQHRDPVQAGQDHPGPEPGALPAADGLGGFGRGDARRAAGVAGRRGPGDDPGRGGQSRRRPGPAPPRPGPVARETRDSHGGPMTAPAGQISRSNAAMPVSVMVPKRAVV